MEQSTYDALALKHSAVDMVRPFWHGNPVKELEDVTLILCQAAERNNTQLCIESILRFYPDIKILVVNGQPDEFDSTNYLHFKAVQHPNITVWDRVGRNGHGDMLHEGIKKIFTKFILVLDNDIIFERGGFIEKMRQQIINNKFYAKFYASGTVMIVSEKGECCSPPIDELDLVRYAHPSCTMIDRGDYLKLRPFTEHGAPCWANMIDAKHKGYQVGSFPVDKYVSHLSGASWTTPSRTIWCHDHEVMTRPFVTFIVSNASQVVSLRNQNDHDFDIVTLGNKIETKVIIHDGKPGFDVNNHLFDIRYRVRGEYVCYLAENIESVGTNTVHEARKVGISYPDKFNLNILEFIKRTIWQNVDCLFNKI